MSDPKVFVVFRSTWDKAPAVSAMVAVAEGQTFPTDADERTTPILSYRAESEDAADAVWPTVLDAITFQSWELAHAIAKPRASRFVRAGDAAIPPELALEGALFYRLLSDGRAIVVWPMSFGKARLCVGEAGSGFIDTAYCYPDPARACEAGRVWSGDGDPLDGWTRHPDTGRRRENGDPTKETVRW